MISDHLICDKAEGIDVSSFIKDIDMNTFTEKGYKLLVLYDRDYLLGDDKNEIILFYSSKLLRQMIDNMKKSRR